MVLFRSKIIVELPPLPGALHDYDLFFRKPDIGMPPPPGMVMEMPPPDYSVPPPGMTAVPHVFPSKY